jgi:hypothetical protein
MPELIWLVLGSEGSTVHAYRDETDALNTVGELQPCVRYVSEKGAKKPKHEADFALVVAESKQAPTKKLRAREMYDKSLLCTNVQKAVRRQDAEGARITVLQYFAQRPTKGTTEYSRKLLLRLPVIAAEDASAKPGLALAMFLYLGATSWDTDSVISRCVEAVAECAAQLALAPRDLNCVADSAGWSKKRVTAVSAGQIAALRPEDAALVWLLGAASKILERGSLDDSSDARWVASLQESVIKRRGTCDSSPYASPASSAVAESLARAEVIFPLQAQYIPSADGHNESRCQALLSKLQSARSAGAPAVAELGNLTSVAALKAAMKPHVYLNLRDAPYVHVLNHKERVSQMNGAFLAWWAGEAAILWAPKPASQSQDPKSLRLRQSAPASVASPAGGQLAAKKQKTAEGGHGM